MQYGLYSELITLLKGRFIETQLNNSYSIAQGPRQLQGRGEQQEIKARW